MKKYIAILIAVLLIAMLMPLASFASSGTSSGDTRKDGSPEAAQPTEAPLPTFEPDPSYEPSPSIEPGLPAPSFAPRPDYEFNGPDEDGYWHSGYPSYAKLSPEEIASLFDNDVTTPVQPYCDEWPQALNEPYVLGHIADENLELTLNRVNMYRRLAGVQDVVLNDEATLYAQYAAWIMNHNQTISHTPVCDTTIPSIYCENGYYGCQRSNLARDSSVHGFISTQIEAYLNDWQLNNLSCVGHRQHFLDTRLVDTGFGTAGLFHSMYVGNKSISAQVENYDFVSWPASDAFPADTDAFTYMSPWSCSFPRSSMKTPLRGELNVKIYHNGELMDDLLYGTASELPTNYQPSAYLTVSSNYTNNYCIIFRPDFNGIPTDERLSGTYEIVISGLHKSISNDPFEVRYKVDFFNLADTPLHDNDPEEPTEPIAVTIYGDIDTDGILTSSDALLILRFCLGLLPEDAVSQQGLLNADINKDGVINSTDAAIVLRVAMGLMQPPDPDDP